MENVKTIISIFAINSILQSVFPQRFEPRLDITSCTKSKVNITVHDAVDGGIVYIQGPGTSCRQSTQAGVSKHVFDVHTCAINWRETFRVIVQRHPLYQTGADKRFPVTCIPDTSDLIVGNRIVNVNVLDKEEEDGVTKTVTPTATMYLYRDGVNVNGKTVQLTEQLTMVIQLDNDYADDFDIEASACHADSIVTIKDSCATDDNLFPTFTHVLQGKLQSTFGVFRPTHLVGGTVNLEFTCTLKVFVGQHLPKTCDDNVGGNAKYTRRLQATNKKVDEILVGNSVLLNTEDVTTKIISPTSPSTCTKETIYIGVIVMLAVLFLLTFVVYLFKRRKLKAERKVRRDELINLNKVKIELEQLKYNVCNDCRENLDYSWYTHEDGQYW
ncbi:uncharacterized protein LOC132749310 [Ruditapes philippinarum]|uniref:uncharacterized protein LOC132749310 n=1 Tax=Ruditapes philippinarum TaxID=129788 RepID=UPI00295B05B7|nr:uncharacterized protein LOC132749310 [Ruditapes philippinarum]